MKKAYSPPDIIFENFSLNTSIAGDCTHINDLPTENVCGFSVGPTTAFIVGVTGCVIQVPADQGFFNGVCYHVPIENNRMFNS